MDIFVAQGGRPLAGRVSVSGSKNAALPIMAAALAASGTSRIAHIPDLADVQTLSALLKTLGMRAERDDAGRFELEVVDEAPCLAEYDLVSRMRASICVLGPLLARRGIACVSLPGGCSIGERPVDLHLKGLAALGADIRIDRGYIVARADRLRGATLSLAGPQGSTVTGTCNVMTAATLAEGQTIIESAACEPEVVDLGHYLNAMGARISGLGTSRLKIEGVSELTGTTHTVIPDRIEAATLLMAAAATRGSITLENVCPAHLTAVLDKLHEIGVEFSGHKNELSVRVPNELAAVDCVMWPYPGVPTDVQAQIMALLTTAVGRSILTDKVFPDRFLHVPELVRLGAKIRREGASAIVTGVPQLSGAIVMASDLRASAALVIAALAAEGETAIGRIYHLDRGYERLETKLTALGAKIERRPAGAASIPDSLRLGAALEERPAPPAEFQVRSPRFLRKNPAPRTAAAEANGASSDRDA